MNSPVRCLDAETAFDFFHECLSVVYITKLQLNIYTSKTCPSVSRAVHALYREPHCIHTWGHTKCRHIKCQIYMRFRDIISCVEARGAPFLLKGLTGLESSTRGRGGGQLKVNIDEAATEMQYAYTTRHSYAHAYWRSQTPNITRVRRWRSLWPIHPIRL